MTMQYYTEDISKVPVKLLYHAISPMMPRPVAWLLAVAIRCGGKLGVRLPPANGVGLIGTETEVGLRELPPRAVSRWTPILEQLRDLNFQPLKCEITATVGAKLQCSMVLLNQLGDTSAILEWTRMPTAKGIEDNTPLEFNSYLDDAPDIVTGVVRKIDVPMSEMFQIESVEMMSLENNCPLEECYQKHRQRCEGKPILQLRDEDALQVIRAHNIQRFEALMETGFIRELTEQEIERLQNTDLTELYAA